MSTKHRLFYRVEKATSGGWTAYCDLCYWSDGSRTEKEGWMKIDNHIHSRHGRSMRGRTR